MSTYYKYAQFDGCTPLSAVAPTDIHFDLDWTLPETDLYKYKKIELYRYIGNLDTVVTNPLETDANAALIFTATQSFDPLLNYLNSVTIVKDYFNGSRETTTEALTITAINNFTDDLNKYNNINTILKTSHNLPETTTDATILEDILTSKRCMYYIMITYINGTYDAVPYCVASHMGTGILDNTSTKTQVRHDILHFEGDLIWATWLVGATHGVGRGISRTGVDLNSLYLNRDAADYGPTGRGGLAWVSDRTTGNIFRCNLNNGLQNARYNNRGHIENPGHAICIDPLNGDCISSAWINGAGLYIRCKTNNISISADENTPNASTQDLGVIQSAYGIVNIPQTGNKFAINNPWIGSPAISIGNLTTNTINSMKVFTITNGYGICSGPDSTLFEGTYSSNRINTYSKVVQNPLDTTPTQADVTGIYQSITCTTDNYTMAPNRSNSKNKYHVIYGGLENGYMTDVSVDSTKPLTSSINPANLMEYQTTLKVQNDARTFRGVGVDGENNIWGIGVGRSKIYRLDSGTTFPTQGSCNYPTMGLDNQPISFTNNSDIEWFLLRDSGYENSTMAISGIGSLDNTYKTMFNGVSTTAHKAWWSLVDDARFEIAPNTNTGTGTKYPAGGFNVVKPNGQISSYTKQYGIRMKDYTTNYAGCLSAIQNWYNTFGNIDSNLYYGGLTTLDHLATGNTTGRRVFPWYGTTDANVALAFTGNSVAKETNTYNPNFANIGSPAIQSYTIVFTNWHGYSYCYSDFTGNILLGSVDSSPINKSITNPEPSDPTFTPPWTISGIQGNGGYQELFPYCYPWNIVTSNYLSSGLISFSGYDDFTLFGTVKMYSGSYDVREILLITDDYNGTSYKIQSTDATPDVFPIDYTYNDPSKIGLFYLPTGNNAGFEHLQNLKPNGEFNLRTHLSALDLYSGRTITSTASANITVLERWPEAKLFVEAQDLKATRIARFTNNTWDLPRFDKSSELRKESRSSDAKRYDTTYGVDPISAVFKDRSIARTYPLSSWVINVSTNNSFLSWYNTGKTISLTPNGNALSVGADEQNFYDTLTGFEFNYGDYVVTMNVAASTTSTSGDKIFTNYIKVAEFEPFANFWPSSASTVASTYSNDTPTPANDIAIIPNGNNSIYPFVSGYAPLLTVFFQDSSDAHTFPIAKYEWNFGDYYNEGTANIYASDSNYFTVTASQIQAGTFDTPNWRTDATAHTAVHSYTMPGTYDVTLTITASVTNTTDLCARYTGNNNVQKFNVYVEEIPPMIFETIKASYSPTLSSTPALSGASPHVFYFSGSGITAGSFPICKMVWDFGDGTTETITRLPSASMTKQGLPLIYHADPRYTIVPHVYTNSTTSDKMYSVGVSAYACNTNTMVATGITDLIGPITNVSVQQDETRKLIGSRFDSTGNMVYVFEGLTTKNTYTVIMSGAL